jgi:hypothetical protein
METTTREAGEMLLTVERARAAATRHSLNNGIVLLVWAAAFLLDMIAFDASRLLGTVWPAVAFVVILDGAVVAWKVWYQRQLPVRPRVVLFDRVIFWWAWYHAALVGVGVGGWAIVIGRYPPFWLTGIGVVGALPLFIVGMSQWRQSHRVPSLVGGSLWQ